MKVIRWIYIYIFLLCSSVGISTEIWVGRSGIENLCLKAFPPILQEVFWALGPVWTGEISPSLHRYWIPDCHSVSSVALPTELPGHSTYVVVSDLPLQQ